MAISVTDHLVKLKLENEKAIRCKPPPLVLNGNILDDFASDVYTVGHKVSYECISGYTLHGSRNMTCTEDGVWISSDNYAGPVCLKARSNEITCSKLSPIRNGFWSSSKSPNERHMAGDKIEAVCDQGYFMDGAASWNCSNDGNWISSDLFFPLCLPFGETEALNALLLAAIVAICVLLISVFFNIAFAIICCKQSRQLKERNNSGEKLELQHLLTDFRHSDKSSMQANKEKSERRTSADNVTQRPEAQPETGHTEDRRPLQRESSNENINENGHDTCLKTVPGDTSHEFVSVNDQSLGFPEQQAVNNEQDQAQKMVIASNITINMDDIT